MFRNKRKIKNNRQGQILVLGVILIVVFLLMTLFAVYMIFTHLLEIGLFLVMLVAAVIVAKKYLGKSKKGGE